MAKRCAALLLCLPLSGCAPSDARDFTPLPYYGSDNFLEITGKTLVNLPAWTFEGAMFTAFLAVYLCAQSGSVPNFHR